ncbi:type IV pilus modification protein PilV [Denitromonas iodatirespirans]|uniref:Type IV pilus modification protein PilV n=1 Tax=Denitromonas iodatirespirans TaxID=2795389 RepID=A0A944DGQ4_DENI1|nr:type IV pilus modification protein PilV [Denitromonas iodatirespirans]MBT0964003.1 type IV pilus modification protein PilV [Denitromonas iodatirespirans]
MPLTAYHQSTSSQRGFSLIESLVAMVVLSFGLLGLAALQVNALKYNQVAHLRSQATTFAYQILDAMRASPTSAKSGNFDIGLGQSLTGTSVAAVQVADWQADLAAQLPGGRGGICRSANPNPSVNCSGNGDFVIITVEWSEADNTGSRNANQFQLVSQVAPSS